MFGLKRKPKSPEELEAQISAKAARRAAKIAAKGKAKTRLDEAREGQTEKSLAVLSIEWAGYILFIAAIGIIAGGYWYDVLFYTQQSTHPGIVAGLLVFALVVRSVAAFGDVILHATKPEKDDDEKDDLGLKALATKFVKNDSDRTWLRRLWVASIFACAFATVSFFSSGHETRQTAVAAVNATERTITDTKATRIAALERQKTEAKEARDAAIAAADATIKDLKDNVDGLSAADNVSLQEANRSKEAATATYTTTLADLNAQINAINAEEEGELKAVTVTKNTEQPFLSVYNFLARVWGTADGWAIAGAWFFAILFELLCAKLLAIVSSIMKALRRIAKTIQMQEAADEMHARIALERMRSNIEVEGIRLRAMAAHERGVADIELARREREVEKAKAQAEALRNGEPWVDPDELLTEKAALKKAENDAEIRRIREQIEKLEKGEADQPTIEPANDKPQEMTPEQFRIWKSQQAKKFYQDALKAGRIPVEDHLTSDNAKAAE